jgi:nucleolar protein 12
LNQT